MASQVEVLKWKAIEAFFDDDLAVAIDLYSQAIHLDPKNAHLFADRAQAYIKLNNFTEALSDAKKAIELDPSMPKAYLRKGAASIKLEEYDTARIALQIGASLAPNDSRFTKLIKECDQLIEDIRTLHLSMERGIMNHGCTHYRRRCKIVAPCCDEVFRCRHCHNEYKNSEEINPLDCHEIPRHEIKKVICSLCDTEQDVQQYCANCGVCMGKYFCAKCKLFDDDISKSQYHCDECGICRTGGKDNFFHCKRCGCCYSIVMQEGHRCIERAVHHDCPICIEYLFDTLRDVTALPCGHTIHFECVKEMEKHFRYLCPVCSSSI